MSDDQDFKKRASAALGLLSRELASAGEDYGFRAGLSGGIITIDCGSAGGKLTIAPNAPSEQVWVQVQGKTTKLDWDIVEASFVHTESGQTLRELLEQALTKQLKQDVTL